MEFKKCARCGCFFASNDTVCCNCANKDKLEISALKSYFDENDMLTNINQVSLNTGISMQNLHRYMQTPDFSRNFFRYNHGNF